MPRLRTPLQRCGPRPGVKKGRKFEPCDRFTLTYAIQEQQTHLQTTTSARACPALFWGWFRASLGISHENILSKGIVRRRDTRHVSDRLNRSRIMAASWPVEIQQHYVGVLLRSFEDN